MNSDYFVSWGMVAAWIRQEYTKLYQVDDEAVKEFKHEIMSIQEQLAFHPFEFGESVDDLLERGVTKCVGFSQRMTVNYGVRPASRPIFAFY